MNAAPPTPPRVLIVDDDPILCAYLDEVLAEVDLEIVYAHSGEEAIPRALQFEPDVILLDIHLPDMSGIEVCRRLKSHASLIRTPVVFVTALSEIESEAEAIKAGATGFIPKPPHRALVVANVQNALRIQAMNREIDRLVDYREKLTHMIVHDINNLLTVSLCNADMMLLSPELPGGLKMLAEAVRSSTHDIQVMTASLLDVAKLESQTLPLQLERIDVAKLVRQRAQLVAHQMKSRSLNFGLEEKKASPVYATADGYLLTRVIDNLLFNAIKFCPSRGNIVSTLSDESGQATLSLFNDGPAIPREYHSKIFAPFAQVEAHQSRQGRGVGLGLALCRMASTAMKGKIEIESPVQPKEDGVCFHLSLPVS